MKAWWMIYVVCLLTLTGCSVDMSSSTDTGENQNSSSTSDSDENLPPDITGYVMEQEDDRILVVDSVDPDSEGNPRAMWVSGISVDSFVGKQVEVWTQGGIQESYPEQAAADHVSVLEMSAVEGADLEAYEALSNALKDLSTQDILSVKMLSFDIDSDEWLVQLSKVGASNGEVEKFIPDSK
ncbi:DUF3221 domain-containing protein [Halobacillus mangrovi]|uniref:DUF3221 domain-containing protein n=1 Tax=Halobacillus mangrovi TaxID=402384 RepID=A0A1W5ZRA4_9BACI|nr:DUF3221 domain-containing protein [Halobacillus mangrovi]ARI75819.1 hypothetical protein HM131_02800 [Halobacillus mangrovi]